MDRIWGISKPSFGVSGPRQSKDFSDAFADRSLLWTFRKGAGEATDRLLGTAVNPKLHTASTDIFSDMGFEMKTQARLNYQELFRLSDRHVPWRELSATRYHQQVRANCDGFREQVKATGFKNLFEGVTPSRYLKETVWGENIRPIKELFRTSTNCFSNLAATAGLGLMGWHVFRNTTNAYHAAQAEEDGTVEGRLKTWSATLAALMGQAFKNLVCWEAASLGLVIGKALIPVGAFPIGGILVGALAATAVYTLLSRWIPDPPEAKKA